LRRLTTRGDHQEFDAETGLLAFSGNGHDLWALRRQHAQKTTAGYRRSIRQLNDMCCVWFGDRRLLTQDGKLNLASCLPTRFHPALETASTFTLDRVVQSKEPEVTAQRKLITWPKQRGYI
jgi:hypothetical protein